MLERSANTHEDIEKLYLSVERDPRSWRDWTALYFYLPHAIPAGNAAVHLGHAVRRLDELLNLADGVLIEPDSHSLLAVTYPLDPWRLTKIGAEAVSYTLECTGLMPSYEIYQLDRDHEDFGHMLKLRFGLDRDMPPSRSSSSLNMTDMTDAAENRSLNVLLVEDDPATRWLVRTALKDKCCLMTAGDGGTALDVVGQYHPDIVFLDMGLPDCNGRDVLEQIRMQNDQVKVVMFTQKRGFDTIVDVLSAGASGFVQKPFHRERLLEYLQIS